jgi:hypothetical protein
MPWTDIVTQVHSNTLTEQRSKFINEYGRLASHILFCEFIDNALKARAHTCPAVAFLASQQRTTTATPPLHTA